MSNPQQAPNEAPKTPTPVEIKPVAAPSQNPVDGKSGSEKPPQK